MGYRLSARAAVDLDGIATYTLGMWGRQQADKYLREMEAKLDLLALRPSIGRVVEHTRRPTLRMEHGSHVVFYREERSSILIVRILHKRMLPKLHLP